RTALAKVRQNKGKAVGKTRYGRGALYSLLRNQVYIGRVMHKGASYSGQHAAIIDSDVWAQVQALMSAHRSGQRIGSPAKGESPLEGLLYDASGNLMSPTFTTKGNVRYRYYVSQAILQNDNRKCGTIGRLSAPLIEEVVADAVRNHWPPCPN